MSVSYKDWLDVVRETLDTINMPMDDWQKAFPFDFEKEYKARTDAGEAADKANRFWWHRQNKAIHQDCQLTANCWLPRGHQGECKPV